MADPSRPHRNPPAGAGRAVVAVSPGRAIRGPLHAEVTGPVGAPPMLFVHPNPMDSSSWIYQMAHFSTWFRCIAVDLPGYGRSPNAAEGLTIAEVAGACWAAVDRHASGTLPAVLVGCSVGSSVVQHMYHLRPRATQAVIMCGTGWHPVKHFVRPRIEGYRREGLGYRYRYTLEDFSPSFATTQVARWFAAMYGERDDTADLATILRMFDALARPDPDWLQRDLGAPALIVSGSLDAAHEPAHALCRRLPDAQLVVLAGAGHACHIERPFEFDAAVIRFLRAHGHERLPVPPGR